MPSSRSVLREDGWRAESGEDSFGYGAGAGHRQRRAAAGIPACERYFATVRRATW